MRAIPVDNSLIKLGLTELESETYVYLVHNSPATGYQIAKATGRPTPNTYKALRTLHDKGAVIFENGQSQLCRAVPPDEFLNGLERQFSNFKAQAALELAKVKQASEDERVYHLHSPLQVYERIRSMLASCQQVALLDLFPEAFDELAPDIYAASSRGITIAVKVYQSIDLSNRGVIVVLDPDGKQTLGRWPGQWANIVVDGSQHLIALISEDGQAVHQAVWSACTFVSWVYHSALRAELLHTLMVSRHNLRDGAADLPVEYTQLSGITMSEAPGYQSLLRQHSRLVVNGT